MLKGKIAVITGANRGIGLATAKVFARNDAEIFACARKPSPEFEAELESIKSDSAGKINPVYFDLTDEGAVKSAVKNIGKTAGKIDILVNNAGVSIERVMGMTTLDFVRKTMDVNYLAMVQMSQLVSRYMMAQKSGSIVNVGSVAGMTPEVGGLAYGSSKAAVIFSTRTMALELSDFNIRVNSVSPGFIDTDMWAKRSAEIKSKIAGETLLKRQGTPEEAANAILFFASDLSSFITGQNLVIDGGRNIRGGGVMPCYPFCLNG